MKSRSPDGLAAKGLLHELWLIETIQMENYYLQESSFYI